MKRAKTPSTSGVEDALALLQHPAIEGLTQKQALFAIHYAASSNGTRSAEKAGYSGNDNQLAVIAHGNIRKPKIRAAIDVLLTDIVMSTAEALARLSDEARGDIGEFFTTDEKGNVMLDLHKAKQSGLSHLLKKVQTTKTMRTDKDGNKTERYTTTFEMYDGQAAKDKILRAHGAYTQEPPAPPPDTSDRGIYTNLSPPKPAEEITEADWEDVTPAKGGSKALGTGKQSPQ